MDAQRHFDDKLIRHVARHAAFVRKHGRYPVSLQALWPSLAVFAFYALVEAIFWYAGWNDRGRFFNQTISVIVSVSVAVMNVRALFFGRIHTALPPVESVQSLQVALAAAGYSLEWTPTHDAAILFVTAGRGSFAKRHAVVFVPADGIIWYNVHDPRGLNFFVTDRKPLRNLIRQLDGAFAR